MKIRSTKLERVDHIAGALGVRFEAGNPARILKAGPDAGALEIDGRLFPERGSDRFRALSSSGDGRRKNSICWHGHFAFMAAIFAADESAVLISALETYRGAWEFGTVAPATESRNVGSLAYPLERGEACKCGLEAGDPIASSAYTPAGYAERAGRMIAAGESLEALDAGEIVDVREIGAGA